MSKLFNLKEWLTLADAARRLSIVCDEDVTEADTLRLALDGHLRLSVRFVNHATARCGKVVRYTEAEIAAANESGELPEDLKWMKFPKDITAAMKGDSGGETVTHLASLRIGKDKYLTLGDKVTTLREVWDLPMVGGEKLDVEHDYQKLTGGPAVTLVTLDGAFVEGGGDQMCQLQEDNEDNEFLPGSIAALDRLKRRIDNEGITGDQADALLKKHEEERKEFLEDRKVRPEVERYFPAAGLPADAVLVVRTKALREFEQSLIAASSESDKSETCPDRAHVSDKLAKMNQAATLFWSNADRDYRGSHPSNADVSAWFVRQGFSQTLADKAATIVRPEWAPSGRKPEE